MKARVPDFGILLLRSTGDTLALVPRPNNEGQYTGRKNALWPWRKESHYAIFCFKGRHHARKKFSFEGTMDFPTMLNNSSDRSDRPSLVSKLLQAGRRRFIKLVCVALTVVSSFAAFGTPDVDAATYVRVRYHGGYYNRYPYRYSGYYHYRGGIYRHRYYRYGRWYYY